MKTDPNATSRIEFREDDEYCRFDGTLMDAAGCVEVYGYDDELLMLDDRTLFFDGRIYSDHDFAGLVRAVGVRREEDGSLLDGEPDVFYVVSDQWIEDCFEGVREILPFSRFGEDHPEISVERYLEFQDALDDYFARLGPDPEKTKEE